MDKLVGDDRIFVRSLASREGHGGLSPSTPQVADVIEGFGMDRILIETVGVGQAEIDVLACTDIVVLVLQPSTGDAIQTMKAGIIEAADIIVVNKSDLPGVDTVMQSLRFLFSLGGPRRGKKAPPVLATSAQQSEGIEALIAEIEKQCEALVASGRHIELRTRRIAQDIRSAIQGDLWNKFVGLVGGENEIERRSAEFAKSGASPYPYVREACSTIEIRLKGTANSNGRKDTRE
jgi:LAO/AO transport system kinase